MIELLNDEDDYLSQGKKQAEELISNRVKKQSRKINQAKKWFRIHAPRYFDFENDMLKLPLELESWMAFMGAKQTQIFKGDEVLLKLADGNSPGIVIKGSNNDSYHVKTKDGVVHKNVSETNIKSSNYVSYENMALYRSAVGFLYEENGLVLQDDIASAMRQLLHGYSREVSTMKADGKMDANEGKMPVTFLGYRMLAFAALGIGFVMDVGNKICRTLQYAHVYLILQWNLMCRTANISASNYQHMWREGDHLLVFTPKQKNDQTGAKAYPKAVYANPLDPIICPILALALWVICCTSLRRDDNNDRLFEGTFCDDKFGDWLLSILRVLSPEQLATLALNILDVGSHSIRKGVATFLSNICGGPSMVSIFIRIGWSLGNVPHRYLHAGEGGDCLVGRLACGLNKNFSTFSILPPHFHSDFQLSTSDWCEIVSGYDKLPEKFKTVCPYLLASLVRHHDWLEKTLNSSHPFFNCRYYKDKWYDKLHPALVDDQYGECEVTRMQATGIPSEIVTACEVRKLRVDVTELRAAMDDIYSKTISVLPPLIVSEMEGRIRVEGQVEVTRNDMVSICKSMEDRLMKHISTHITGRCEEENVVVNDTGSNVSHDDRLWKHLWGGKFHPVPEGWIFDKRDTAGKSTLTVKSLWELWFIGHAAHEIPPYRKLKSFDLCSKRDKEFLSKCSRVMNKLLDEAYNEGLVTSKCGSCLRDMAAFERDAVFITAFKRLNSALSENREDRRIGELKVRTYYNNICKA